MAVYVATDGLVGAAAGSTAYEVGQAPRLALAVWQGTTQVDPQALALKIRDPGGATTTPATVKDAVGQYHYDLTLTLGGRYTYTWKGTGANAGAASDFLDVRGNLVP